MSLLTITAPGDVVGAITAGFGAMTSLANAVQAIAADQSDAGLQLKRDLAIAIAIPISIMGKLDILLGISVANATPSPPK